MRAIRARNGGKDAMPARSPFPQRRRYAGHLSRTRAFLRRARRPRLALVTPWPPERSGVADYSLRLTRELARSVDVDVIVGGPAREYDRPRQQGVRLVGWRSAAAALRRCDRVLHCMGNSQYHRHVYELLLAHGGAVMLHDVQLTGFYGWYAGVERPEDPLGRLVERVQLQYGARIPPEELRTAPLSLERRVALGIYLTAEVQQHAERLFVHSRFARDLVEGDGQTVERRPPVSVMPFGMPAPLRTTPLTPPAEPPLVVHMGVVSEVKGVAVLIQAFARLAADHPGARLVIAGPGDASDQTRWEEFAAEHAPNAAVEFPGHLDRARYEELLCSADLAVQLRTASNGEASGAICDCLAAGVPTIVTDLGWTGELPRNAVAHTPPATPPERLAALMQELITDLPRRTALTEAGLAHARANSFGHVAAAYLDALALA
jgi:glycosyltransferase involved in cell wall biosynthesis